MTARNSISDAVALFSPDRKYRYVLRRRVGFGDRSVLVVMLNPSTADHERNDNTVRRVIGFVNGYGFSLLTVCNAFALKSTDPKELYRAIDPVGPDNDEHLEREARSAEVVIAGWGNHGALFGRSMIVRTLLRRVKPQIYCWDLTSIGEPCHPLFLPKTRPLMLLP